MNLTYLKHPHHHPPQHYSLRAPSYSPTSSPEEPQSEDSSPKGRKRHQPEPAFIQPQNVDRGLTPGLSVLLAEMSPLAPYRIERSAKVIAKQKLNAQK